MGHAEMCLCSDEDFARAGVSKDFYITSTLGHEFNETSSSTERQVVNLKEQLRKVKEFPNSANGWEIYKVFGRRKTDKAGATPTGLYRQAFSVMKQHFMFRRTSSLRRPTE